jgi:predicted alpha/beta-hydrolase family hydrolase
VTLLEVDTPHGPARAHLDADGDARGLLVLGHGAGGGVSARDLVAVARVARSEALAVALVEQPYKVAGAARRRLRDSWTLPGKRSSPRCPPARCAGCR